MTDAPTTPGAATDPRQALRSTASRTSGRRYGGSRAPTPSTASGRSPRAVSRSSPSTPRRPPRAGQPAHRPRLQLHAHRLHGPLQADAGPRGLLPDRLGRQRAAHREPRAELLRRARRRLAALRRRTSSPRTAATPRASRPPTRCPISRQNFIELCDELTVKDEMAFESLFRRLGFSLDWDISYRTIDDHSRATAQQALPAQPRPRRGLPVRGARALGRHLPDRRGPGRARGARLPRRLPPRRVPRRGRRAGLHRDDPPRADPVRASRSSPTPTTSGMPSLFGTTVTLAAVRGRGAGGRPPRRPRRTRAPASPCAARSATSPTCMWWRELQLPTRSVITRTGRIQAETPDWLASGPGERLFAEMADEDDFSAREAVVAALRESGDLDGEPKPTQRKANFYEKGDKPARDRHLAPVVHPQRRPRRRAQRASCIERGRELDFHPGFMRARYENWVERPQRRLADLAAALLRRADPGLVPRSTTTATRSTSTSRSSRPRTQLPVDPAAAGARGLRRVAARPARWVRR